MLVSAIANFQAINAQHRAGIAMMQANEAMLGGIRQAGMSNSTNFYALHQQDMKNDTQMAKAQFMYKVATAWKKHVEAKMEREIQQEAKLNCLA